MLRMLVLDPGETCGLLTCTWSVEAGAVSVTTQTCSLHRLPETLASCIAAISNHLAIEDEALLAYETFHLRLARQQVGSAMPSAEGIGTLKGMSWCLAHAWSIAGLPPGCKTAGRAYAARNLWRLSALAAAHDEARNDHERDVCDLASYVIRQRILGKAPFA